MKIRIIILLLTVCFLFTSGALADALPSRPDVLPVPDIQSHETARIPNPGSYFGKEGKLDQTGYSYQGELYEIWYFEAIPGWDQNLNQFLMDCTAAGYEWKKESIEDKDAYVFSNGEKKAYLFPDYYGMIMFMKQEDIPMSDFVRQEDPAEALEKGELRAVINGTVYQFNGGHSFMQDGMIECMFYKEKTRDILKVYLPVSIKTGETYTIDQKSKRQSWSEFMVECRTLDFYFSQSHLYSSVDGIRANIIYAQTTSFDLPREIKCHYEGTFEGGANTIVMDFYTGYDY